MSQEEEVDDVSGIPYTPSRIDYMRDVFRPKVFVPASNAPPLDASVGRVFSPSLERNAYRSVYGGIYDFEKATVAEKAEMGEGPEEEEAKRLFQRIQEIEKKHESESTQSVIVDSSTPLFDNKRCGCLECSPRFDEKGAMYCGLCSVPLPEGGWIMHMQSICHQLKRKRGEHVYINPYMDPNSTMFRVMTDMGWEEGIGLGADGSGRLEPIPTRLKNNRLGVGAREPKSLAEESYDV